MLIDYDKLKETVNEAIACIFLFVMICSIVYFFAVFYGVVESKWQKYIIIFGVVVLIAIIFYYLNTIFREAIQKNHPEIETKSVRNENYEKKKEIIVENEPKSLRELYKRNLPIKKIICTHCLKSILINDLDAICPFCDTVYSGKTDNVLDVLLNKCPKCDGKIKLYQCVYCRNHIDLFAPYNEAELEKQRYE
ncbi:MAG: hypothetical protein CSYNP_03108 [Syntrophus sp. SKADARSKE-3]|nr:hypothetical protein [Syntrophus sp. SKADARSKE-3]